MKATMRTLVCGLALSVLPAIGQAVVIDFDFTGRLVVRDSFGYIISNNGQTYTPISASLSYDTELGLGNSGLSISLDGASFLDAPPTFHDITMNRQGSTNLVTGQVLVDWNGTNNMQLHIEWDATGLFNAIAFGLQAGDVLSGSTLYRDANGNHAMDAGEFLTNIGSATPYSDSLQPDPAFWQGPAPLAATSGSLGLDDTTPFSGVRGYFDIGSGNSMVVNSVSTVPVPAAVWLFGSGLMGLIGMARRKAS